MKAVFWITIAALLVLHHDFWFWNSDYLVGGVLPIGLAYHVGLSMVITIAWWVLTVTCWPRDLEVLEEALEVDTTASPGSRRWADHSETPS